ncbi:MAG: hypothetical protein ACR2OJ_07595 [Hyphomicrobiales bacterium]
MKRIFIAAILVFLTGSSQTVVAGGANVEDVKIEKSADGSFTFHVTVKHGDTGWDHYANKWEVSGPDGTVYGTRILHHPHENEQPFTRSKRGVEIPEGVEKVTIKAYDSVHGATGEEMTVDLPR